MTSKVVGEIGSNIIAKRWKSMLSLVCVVHLGVQIPPWKKILRGIRLRSNVEVNLNEPPSIPLSGLDSDVCLQPFR